MKKNVIFKCILKYMPIYALGLFFLLLFEYINSLTGLFVGEILGLLNGDEHILPSFLISFIDQSSVNKSIISIAIIYIVISLLGTLMNFLSRTVRTIHYQKLYIGLSKEYYKHILDIPKNEYSKRSTGDILQRNTEDCKRIATVFRFSLYEVFRIIFSIVTLLTRLFILSKYICVAGSSALIACIFLAWYYGILNSNQEKYNHQNITAS